jgi:exosortase A-associated hydrolase 1
MGERMRRLLTFACQGATLGATLDGGGGAIGLLMVTGGSQTRIGSHRMYERLAAALAGDGTAVLRFDRRGVGDSEGNDPGFRGSGPDIAAAAEALRREGGVDRIIGFGLCDGATALALHGAAAGLDGVILVNPWLTETESDSPAPAAIRRHYRDRLLSREGWKKLLSGSISLGKLFAGLRKSAQAERSSLASEVAAALRSSGCHAELILAAADATAVAATHELKDKQFRGLIAYTQTISSNSHTFAQPGDAEALLAATRAALRRSGT